MKRINQIYEELKIMKTQENQVFKATEEELKKYKIIFFDKARKICQDFKVDDENREQIVNMILYFTGKQSCYDLNKGLFLFGNCGSGKSILMQIFQSLMQDTVKSFKFISSFEIVQYYMQNGDFDLYNLNEKGFLNRPIKICIDELGAEALSAKYFGTEINPIKEVLQLRYNLFQKGVMTHVTTNLKPEEIKLIYGERVADRMNEMFNIIFLKSEESRRK